MLNTSQLAKDELLTLIQKENFVGWIYSIDYEKALVITNDLWKSNVKGIPHNSFLLATSFEPDKYGEADEADKEIILLRVIGSCRLPQDDDMIKTKIDNYQNKTGVFNDESGFDSLTRNRLQFGGLECRVLGTFYMKQQELNLGSDVETFYTSLQMRVFMPTSNSLEKVVNFVDPIRKKRSLEDFRELGIQGEVSPFRIGTVRYTSTDRLHRAENVEKVKFYIQPADFLARRTAVLGMTRTGKSNMIKQTVSVVKEISSNKGMSFSEAEKWFAAARIANKERTILTASKNAWLDNECIAMLNLLVGLSANDGYIRGFRTIEIAKEYHSPAKTTEVCDEIYNYLYQGKIVILDLSVGNATLRERISKNIASYIFHKSMEVFTEGRMPQNIVIYIEEAHNLIGKGMDLTETWPRLAKEVIIRIVIMNLFYISVQTQNVTRRIFLFGILMKNNFVQSVEKLFILQIV